MTSGQKIAFSTLLSMLLFAGFVITANLKLFPELETRFYAQTKVSQKLQHLDDVAESFDSYISNILKKADDFAKTPSVTSFIEQNPSEKSVIDRRNRIEKLFNEVPPLTGLRIVDKNGRNVHYSSFDKTDLLKQNGITKVYKNYIDIQRDLGELDFSVIKTDGAQKVLVDSRRSRLIISEPFYWFDDIQNGDIFFYLNLYDIREAFVSKNVFSYGEGFSIYNDDTLAGGIALGVPLNAQEDFKIPVLSSWKKEKASDAGAGHADQPVKIVSSSDGEYWTILSARAAKYLKISGIYRSSNFELSKDLIWLIYTCVFITIFLLLYLIFSLGQDSLSLVRKKIKKLQAGIIQEYLERKQDIEWSKIAQALRLRKSEFINNLSEGLSKKNRRHKKEIDELLEKTWNDIIEVFEKQENTRPVQTVVQREEINLSEIRNVIEEVLGSKLASVQAVAQKPVSAPASLQSQPEDVEEIEEVEEVEEVDDLEDVEEIEDVEEVEDIEDLDDLEDVTEVDEVDEPDDLEEVEDVEDVQELDEVEEVDQPEPVEEIEEVAELDEADDLEEVEELEELQEEVEELPEEGVEDLPEEVEELEDLEEEEDLESLDDIEEAEEIEDLEEASEEAEYQGSIEELPEYDEFIGEKDTPYEDEAMTFYSVDNILPGRDEYLEDTDAFIRSDRFASVTNLFAEEITLGDEYDTFTKRHPSNVINNFRVHKLSDMFTEKTDLENDGILAGSEELLEDIADLTEEVPPAEGKPYFAMTDFAKKDEIEALEEVVDRDHVIFENDGVFQIAKNLDYSAAQYNTEFKALVDSVLHK